MKKYKIQEAADLLKAKTHAIYTNANDFNKLKNVLKLAYPNDLFPDNYEFEVCNYYGFHRKNNSIWADTGFYLEELETIHLSEILNITLSEISNITVVDVETVTISKEDYNLSLIHI